ncbi:hypothetical protein ILUMI_13440 [Ignelater luminosus]|uniref:Nocturnin n=1 Tax=Ignelater luminosus TaxID=2038154 RepID=A0A8K0CSF0_IGNLU|nr:hypothetical protein ILUMI_13440 [Ignelater luminosus]
MGSFNSAPKILNDDNQDSDVRLPEKISRHDLLQHCQKYLQLHPMIKRNFRKAKWCDNDYSTKFEKLNSVSKAYSDYVSSPYNIRVLQWNILSQALGVMNDNFARCPDEALDWNFRRYRIVEEIVQYCPDVICLQEVDHFNFLKHVLGTQGYSGMFFPKPDSPCFYIEGNNGPDGCAIFYRKNKFELVKTENKILEIWRVQSNQVALLAVLRIRETGQEICITTTHLKARQGALLSTLRNEQGKDLLQFISNHCDNRPIILCGDFNAEPTEPVYSTILSNQLFAFSSAYAGSQEDVSNSADGEPLYTTWKIREEGEVCHTIDYVFYSKNAMDVEAVLDFPSSEDIGEDRVPSFLYPSDHFSLVCDFRLASN